MVFDLKINFLLRFNIFNYFKIVIILFLANNLDTRICKIPNYDDMNVDPEDTPSPLTVNECLGKQVISNSITKLKMHKSCLKISIQ